MNGFKLRKLLIAIEKSGYKKKYIAEQCDVSPARLSQFLSGRYEISEKVENKLTKLFKL